MALDQHLINTYPKGEGGYAFTEVASLLGDQLHPAFDSKELNGISWTQYVIIGPNGLLIDALTLPISDQTFLEIVFEYSANNGVLPRDFNAVARSTIVAAIESTLQVSFATERFSATNKTWLSKSIEDIFQENETTIIPRLFGSELRKAPEERLSPKLQKMLGQPVNTETQD